MALVRAVRYAAFLFLGGLLVPADFGRFAAIFVVVNGLALFQGFGLGPALLYRRERVPESADTVFVLSLSLGLSFFALAWLGAPMVEGFFGEPGLAAPFRVCALVIVCRAVQTVPLRLFEKQLVFRSKFLPGLIGSVVYAGTALTLAVRGAGVWSLVCGEVGAACAEAATYWFISTWRPRFRFDVDVAREDLRFGWVVLGGTTLVFLFQGVDRVAVSKFLGTHPLGLYAFVFTLGSLPATYFVRSLNTVLLPSYTSPEADPSKRRELYLLATSHAAALGFAFVLGVVFFGASFLQALYGAKWLAAAGAFSALAMLGVFQSFSSLNEDLIVALGRPAVFRALNGLRLAVALAGLWFGATVGGIAGVALVMAMASAVSCVLGWRAVGRLASVGALDLARSLRGPAVAAVAAAVVSFGLVRAVRPGASLPAVSGAVAVMVATYAAVWLASDRGIRDGWRRFLAGSGVGSEGR